MASGQNQSSPPSPGRSNDRFSSTSTAFYLEQLLWDKYVIDCMPNLFTCADKLINEEIRKVKSSLLNITDEDFPEIEMRITSGPIVSLSEKLFVPFKEYPDFNFVGRILGPRGMTAKQLEQKTGCKIMVRGKGSMRDKHKEECNRGKHNWEHLNEDLHVLITVEDCKDIAEAKIERAKREISKLLVPSTDGEDELKRFQLMELAILNGTYRTDSHENYHKNKILDSDPLGRALMHNAILTGIFFPQCMQSHPKPSKESAEKLKSVSPNCVMGYSYQNPYSSYFSANAEVGGVVYVDPYAPLGGSAYFGSQSYSETSTKTGCD